VVGFDDVPRVRDRAAASRLPELAVLSVLAHPELEIAEVALEAISRLREDQAKQYIDVILTALPDAHRQILEAQMQAYEYQSELARKCDGQGLEQGREQGLRVAAVALARTKLCELSAGDLAAIDRESDQLALTELSGTDAVELGRSRRQPDGASTRATGSFTAGSLLPTHHAM
jgi:hypothetical protein